MLYRLTLLAALAACTPHPVIVQAPEPLPKKGPPPGAEPFGYWEGDTMTVLLSDTMVEPCMRTLVHSAAQYVGDLAGVFVVAGDYTVTGKSTIGINSGEVLVVPLGVLPPDVAAMTTPELQSGGWVAAAWVAYDKRAQCNEKWFRVFVHEFGHVYGLSDTRDDPQAVMHWANVQSDAFRPWELEHLRRRIFNR